MPLGNMLSHSYISSADSAFSEESIFYEDRQSHEPMPHVCICPQHFLKDMKDLKGFDLLDGLSLVLDSYAFNIRWIGNKPLPSQNTSVSAYTYQKCLAQKHTIRGEHNFFSVEKLSEEIQNAGKKKDPNSIKALLLLASKEEKRKLFEKLCNEKPEHSYTSYIMLENVKQAYRRVHNLNIVALWTGYQAANWDSVQGQQCPGVDTLVVVTKDNVGRKTSTFWGLDVIIASQDSCSPEAKNILVYELADQQASYSVQIDGKTSDKLFKSHSNITLINQSNVRSKGYNTEKATVEKTPSIVIYCHIKGIIPVGESLFPKEINGYPVDVREATCSYAAKPLRIGDKIKATQKTGTLGGFVDVGEPKRKAFLTSAHILLRSENPDHQQQFENVVYDNEQREIGKRLNTVMSTGNPNKTSIDAALVEITDRHPCDGFFSDMQQDNKLNLLGLTESPHFCNGQMERISTSNCRKPILKYGAGSGMTHGFLKIGRSSAKLSEYDVMVSNNRISHLYGMLEVLPVLDPTQPSDSYEPFVSTGDSGALVFALTSENPTVLKCIGMVVALTSYGSCLMTPIHEIFDALGLEYNCFSKFDTLELKKSNHATHETRDFSFTEEISILHSKLENIATKKDVDYIQESLNDMKVKIDHLRIRVIAIETYIQKDSENEEMSKSVNDF